MGSLLSYLMHLAEQEAKHKGLDENTKVVTIIINRERILQVARISEKTLIGYLKEYRTLDYVRSVRYSHGDTYEVNFEAIQNGVNNPPTPKQKGRPKKPQESLPNYQDKNPSTFTENPSTLEEKVETLSEKLKVLQQKFTDLQLSDSSEARQEDVLGLFFDVSKLLLTFTDITDSCGDGSVEHIPATDELSSYSNNGYHADVVPDSPLDIGNPVGAAEETEGHLPPRKVDGQHEQPETEVESLSPAAQQQVQEEEQQVSYGTPEEWEEAQRTFLEKSRSYWDNLPRQDRKRLGGRWDGYKRGALVAWKKRTPKPKPVGGVPPQMPPQDAPWNTNTVKALFDYWREKPLVTTHQLSEASKIAHMLALNYTRQQVVDVRTYMYDEDPWWKERREHIDIFSVGKHIHIKLQEMVKKKTQGNEHSPQSNGYLPPSLQGLEDFTYAPPSTVMPREYRTAAASGSRG